MIGAGGGVAGQRCGASAARGGISPMAPPRRPEMAIAVRRLPLRSLARIRLAPGPAEIDWVLSVSHVENFGVFEQSTFGRKNGLPSLADRLRFTRDVLRRRRPAALGFWPWLSIREHALPGLAMLYGLYRRHQAGR